MLRRALTKGNKKGKRAWKTYIVKTIKYIYEYNNQSTARLGNLFEDTATKIVDFETELSDVRKILEKSVNRIIILVDYAFDLRKLKFTNSFELIFYLYLTCKIKKYHFKFSSIRHQTQVATTLHSFIQSINYRYYATFNIITFIYLLEYTGTISSWLS